MVFAKYPLNHRLSLNLMSLNQDCTEIAKAGPEYGVLPEHPPVQINSSSP